MRISDWSSDVCSSDLRVATVTAMTGWAEAEVLKFAAAAETGIDHPIARAIIAAAGGEIGPGGVRDGRSEEHTSELQSLMRISYAVLCLKKKTPEPKPTKQPTTAQTPTQLRPHQTTNH